MNIINPPSLFFVLQHGRNCLHVACHYGHVQTVSVILRMEVIDINCTSKVKVINYVLNLILLNSVALLHFMKLAQKVMLM